MIYSDISGGESLEIHAWNLLKIETILGRVGEGMPPPHTHVYKLASLFCLNLDFLFITESIRTLGHLLDQFQLHLPPPQHPPLFVYVALF